MDLKCIFWITILTFTAPSARAGWGYMDQSGWSALHNTSCGGVHQSPIDLPNVCSPANANVTRVNPSLNLRLINYDMQMPPSVLTLRNNGHTAVVSLRDSRRPNAWLPKISGSVVGGDKYQLLQLHFHWDANVRTVLRTFSRLLDCSKNYTQISSASNQARSLFSR